MRKYALLKNNNVIEIQSLTSEQYPITVSDYQMGIDIEDVTPQPELGWVLVGNELKPPTASPSAELIAARIRAARLFGTELVGEMVDRIGTKNILLGKTESDILVIVSALSGIKALLEGGALVTARTAISGIRLKYTYLTAEMDYSIDRINTFLSN